MLQPSSALLSVALVVLAPSGTVQATVAIHGGRMLVADALVRGLRYGRLHSPQLARVTPASVQVSTGNRCSDGSVVASGEACSASEPASGLGLVTLLAIIGGVVFVAIAAVGCAVLSWCFCCKARSEAYKVHAPESATAATAAADKPSGTSGVPAEPSSVAPASVVVDSPVTTPIIQGLEYARASPQPGSGSGAHGISHSHRRVRSAGRRRMLSPIPKDKPSTRHSHA